MNEQMERLIEEIKKSWCEWCVAEEDGVCHAIEVEGKDCTQDIERVIARIGKAYADGELELPGEVGRIIFHGIKEGQRLEDLRFKMGDILIALRKDKKK